MGDYHLEVWTAVRTPTRQGSCDKENWILEGQGRCGAVCTSSKKQQRDPERVRCVQEVAMLQLLQVLMEVWKREHERRFKKYSDDKSHMVETPVRG